MSLEFEVPHPFVHAVLLKTKQARRVTHLAMHAGDLRFAAGCLAELRSLRDETSLAAEALWRAAIVAYVKCFSASRIGGRSQLDAGRIIPAGQLRDDHRLFLDIRNSQIAHDEGTRSFGWAYALIPPRGYSPHAGPVMVPRVDTGTVGQDNLQKLETLIKHCFEWTEAEFHKLGDAISEGLRSSHTHEQLLQASEIT